MNEYRVSKHENNLLNYINNKHIIENIENMLCMKFIKTNALINIINILADFVQYNKFLVGKKSINDLADFLVVTIELFNNNNELIDEKRILDKLQKLILDLKKEIIDDIKINIYFYGIDEYKMIDKSLNKNIQIIEDMNSFIYEMQSNLDEELNILILSEETIIEELDISIYFNDLIYYDKTMNYILKMSNDIYYSNYDYNYILNSIEEAKSKNLDMIIVGNSYPLTGIVEKSLKYNTINLSLSSQDLYYSYKLAKLVIENNTKIKKCIIGGGYYLINHDLSKSQTKDAISRVKNVYYPILQDKHNSSLIEYINSNTINQIIDDKVLKYIFNLDYLDGRFKYYIYKYNNGYFNYNVPREQNNMLGNVKLSELSEEDKYILGKIRANQHNKLSKYNETTQEYNLILNEFITFLNNKNVEPIVVIFPNTKYYSEFLNKNYEKQFYNIINNIKISQNINLIDFSKFDIFEERDFIDFDHMSEIGAIKITDEINKRI